MGFKKQKTKPAKTKILIQQKNPYIRELTTQPTAWTLDLMGIIYMYTVLGVPYFELVHEGVKVKLNSVNLTEFT